MSATGLRENLTGMFSLPKEIALNLPLVILTGKEEINIENYKNIVEFTDQRIRINTTSGQLVIDGAKLAMKQLTAENIIITGIISEVRYT